MIAGCQAFIQPQVQIDPQVVQQDLHEGKLDGRRTADLCMTTADRLSEEGFSLKAIALYEKARHLNPQLKVSRGLAKNYAKLGQPINAEQEFQRALGEEPLDADLLNDFGCFYLRSNRLPEASSMLRRAVAANPLHQRATMNLAECCVRNGQVQEGINIYQSQVGPAAALSNTAILLAGMGRTQEAEDLFRQALALDPGLDAAKAFLSNLERTNPALAARQVATE
jgi:Tfp pilus assembly protein PilF